MRMGLRRFTRTTNSFSKKLENHIQALSIYFMHYNFVRIHQTIRCSPAMEAGVTDQLWSLEDIVGIVRPQCFNFLSINSAGSQLARVGANSGLEFDCLTIQGQ